ncbi:ABC transporter ATP-binding protein [Falsiroseomonas sp.]|uniref:ABC transporter ATP-binding protein n=1 Tax=Falsiroseomonas sp. TaxID=2870721 RepID=UPI00356930A9
MPSLLEVRDLDVRFPVGGGWLGRGRRWVRALDGVSVDVAPGEIVAVVGESGCGKTTLARSILGLVPPSAGSVRFRGAEVSGLDRKDMLAYRRAVQMVFQDPFDSLNPRRTVFGTLARSLRIHGIVPQAEMRAEVARLLDRVGLSPGVAFLDRYPHQFSGGQRQRIGIARALAVRPEVIVADEAVSALDISIRAQILSLMQRLRDELGVVWLFITHDLGVVRSVCDRVVVMYLGRVVEEGPTEALFRRPRHPYSTALINACPVPDPVLARALRTEPLGGDPPSPLSPPPGCRFHTRCPVARRVCAEQDPPLRVIGRDRRAACHFAEEAESWPMLAHLTEDTPA